MSAPLAIVAIVDIWKAVPRIATPLVFGRPDVRLCERIGMLNLGMEGIMSLGAIAGWLTVWEGRDLRTGMLVAALAKVAFGLLHTVLSEPLGLTEHVTGLGYCLLRVAPVPLCVPPRRADRRPAADR